MNIAKCIFPMVIIIFMLGCKRNPEISNDIFPEYFNEDLQETYLKELEKANIQQYENGSISCTVKLTTEYHIEVVFKNELEIPVPIGKSLLLIDTLSGKKDMFMWTPFRVYREGEIVRYIGKIANVRNLKKPNYVIIPPKETYTANINLEDYYDLSRQGNYTIKYEAFNSTCYSILGQEGLMKIESNTLEFSK